MNVSISTQQSNPYQHVRNYWERSWSRENFSPGWMKEGIPPSLLQAVDSGWFSAGAKCLDIGCGHGAHSAWLAEQGFDVLGIDFADAAIAIAQARYPAVPGRLAFQVADACQDKMETPQYGALYDRGCLHGLLKTMYPAYAATVASWALPGAHFLLLYALDLGNKTDAEVHALYEQASVRLTALFAPFFEINRIESIHVERQSHFGDVPGMAIWMTRCAE